MSPSLYFETGLVLTQKGYAWKDIFSTFSGGSSLDKYFFNLHYLELPMNLKIKRELGNVKVYGSLGPYAALGLVMRFKSVSSYNGLKVKDVEYDADFDGINRIDVGINIGSGVEIGPVGLGITYGYGITNLISDNDFSDSALRLRVLSTHVTYKLSRH